MTEEIDFGSRGSNFEELLKKYKAIDADEPAVEKKPVSEEKKEEKPVEVKPEPEAKKNPESAAKKKPAAKPKKKAAPKPKVVVESDPVAAPEVKPEVAVQPEPEITTADENVFEEELNSIFDSNEAVADVPEDEHQEEFSFDPSLFNGESVSAANKPEVPAESAAPIKEEPRFGYDLNMFGGSVPKAFDADSYDDSWLDNSLDSSVFYDPAASAQSQDYNAYSAEVAEETEPSPYEEPEVQSEPEQPDENEFIPVNEPEEQYPAAGTGGFVAQDDFDGFEFDEDSGMTFDEEDAAQSLPGTDSEPDIADEKQTKAETEDYFGYGGEYKTPDELEGLPVFTPATPDKKTQKVKAKKEAKSVTKFSKSYKPGSQDDAPAKKGFFRNNFVIESSDSGAEKLRKIIMIIAVLAIIASGAYLFVDYVVMPYLNDKEVGELNELLGDSDEVLDELTMQEKYPDIDFPDGMLEKYADVYARNQDLVGWIEIDGLDISLPVVQGVDNNQYLKTNFDGKTSKYGSIFMNSANTPDMLDYNTTLFGHHMKDMKMFGMLKHYKTVNGYKKAPIIEFGTLFASYKWKVFAVFITNGTDAGDNGYLFNYMFTDLSTNQKVEEFLGEIKLRSIYYPQVDIALSDKILTLSTCTYELDEGRLIVMARMVRPGESEEVDVNAVRYNSNPRYPQAYYDKLGKSNPYTDYVKWFPS